MYVLFKPLVENCMELYMFRDRQIPAFGERNRDPSLVSGDYYVEAARVSGYFEYLRHL